MADGNATASRLGLVNNTGTDYEKLFLKVFSGEVLTAFSENNVFSDALHTVRTISSGKAAQFPVTGTATAAYHTPGNLLTGGAILHNEKVINIDDLLIAQTFVANIDELMNHYDVRSIYASELGKALAKRYDQNVAKTIANASRASATLTGGSGGTVLTLPSGAGNTTSAGVDGDELAAAIYDIAQVFDENDIPKTDRYVVLPPAEYYKLPEAATRTISTDYNPGGNGSYGSGNVQQIAGMPVIMSNNVPQVNRPPGVDDSGDASADAAELGGSNNTYAGDDSKTLGLVFHKSAVGTVKLLDLQTEMSGQDYGVMYQGTLMVAKYALGHGILRPEAAATIKLNTA